MLKAFCLLLALSLAQGSPVSKCGKKDDGLLADFWEEDNYYRIVAESMPRDATLMNNNGNRPGNSKDTHSCGSIRQVPNELRSRSNMYPNGLSQFYQKYTEAYGLPVVGSINLSDEALMRACYTVRFMFADRADLRQSYYKYYGRFALIGAYERTTQIPEFSDMDPCWDQRARGFGATPWKPVSLGAEENAMCYTQDRYYGQDIVVHEFAHGIQILGADFAIPGFKNRLISLYNSAKAQGLWRNTYSMSTEMEYFAEGVQSYFGVQRYANPPDGINNHVDTRDKLRSYDRALHDIIQEIFPCNNQFLKRCETTRAAELYQNLRMNCDGQGPGPTQQPPGPTPAPTQPPGGCIDNDANCMYWAILGECQNNPGYMLVNCRLSCDSCGTSCTDDNQYCADWARNGECQNNPGYMLVNCKRSCGTC